MKKNYKMLIQYDGSRYHGWQYLKDQPMTIQGKLQEVLRRYAGDFTEVIGSGRTDAGVHAIGQVANFALDTSDTPEEIRGYLNRYLPDDIAVLSVEEADARFHARYNAHRKTYRYRIRTSAIPDVFERKYVYTYTEHELDIRLMQKAAAAVIGEHDFYSFCGNSHVKKSTIKTIYAISIYRKEDEIIIEVTGNGFLQNMVRILTGTLIEVGAGLRPPESMNSILDAHERSAAGFMAPPEGLALLSVEY